MQIMQSTNAPDSSPCVLFLAAGVNSPSVRFRLLQYLPYLQAQGITVEISDLAVPAVQRCRLFARAANFDAVLVHRALLPPLDYWLLRHAASPNPFRLRRRDHVSGLSAPQYAFLAAFGAISPHDSQRADRDCRQ